MRIPRIFHPELLPNSGRVALDDDAANHVGRVFRMKVGQDVLLFDGSGAEFPAVICDVSKKTSMSISQSVSSAALNRR